MNKKPIGMGGAALIQFASKYLSMAAQLITTAILARLLTPDDFGLLAIVMVFSGLFSLISDMGVGTAIVQYQDLTERDYGGLFVFSGLLSFALVVLFCITSPLIAYMYGDERLISLCCSASPTLLFSTLNMVPNGLMLRELKFRAIGLRLIVATVLSGVAAIAAALCGWGCYSLILQTVLSAAIVFIWNFVARPVKCLNFGFMSTLRRIFSYSVYQFGFSLVNYFSRSLDNMLVGGFLGPSQLGFYDKAYKLTTYPLSAFSSVAASVIQPFMSKYQDKPEAIFSCWRKVMKLISLVGVAVAVVFNSASAEIIEVFYGRGWEEAVPVFSVLAISVYFQMMGNPSGAFFQSLGHTDYMFKVSLINTSLTLAGLFIGLAGGSIVTVAYGIAAAFTLHMVPIAVFLIRFGFNESYRCLKVFAPEIVVGAVAIALCHLLSLILPFSNTLLLLIIKIIVCCLILLIGYMITGQLKYIVTGLRKAR